MYLRSFMSVIACVGIHWHQNSDCHSLSFLKAAYACG